MDMLLDIATKNECKKKMSVLQSSSSPSSSSSSFQSSLLQKQNNDCIKPCGKSRCMTCNYDAGNIFSSTLTRRKYHVINHDHPLSCDSSNIIYLISCSRCGIQYVGETSQKLNLRMNNHRAAIRGQKNTLLTEHFRGDNDCHIDHCIVQPIEKIDDMGSKQDLKKKRLEREAFWIKELRTLTPYGLNDRLDSKNWRYRWRSDIAGKCFNLLSACHSRGARGKRISVIKTKPDNMWFLNALRSSFTNLTNWRNLARLKINSLNYTELYNLSWLIVELSNDCSTDYPRQIIDLVLDMVNFRIFHMRNSKTKKNMNNFVKIYFQAKEVEEVRLSSIFRRHLNSIPFSFQDRDPPTILYSRSPNIGSTIFNYKNVVDSVITDHWKDGNPMTCDCKNSAFCDPHHGHIVTGNLKVIENRQLRKLMSYGPGYREAQNIRWSEFLSNVKSALEDCVGKWAQRENVDHQLLAEWYNKVMDDVHTAVTNLSKRRKKTKKMILKSPSLLKHLENLHKDFVFTPTDKASNNIAIICKKFYVEQSMKELDIFLNVSNKKAADKTYVPIKENKEKLLNRHRRYMKANSIGTSENLPFLYWIPKMHKKPYSKQRYIAASARCSTKPLSAMLTKCLNLVEKQHRIIGNRYFTNHGTNPMWIVNNSTAVHNMLADLNRKKQVRNIRTYDFSTLYTNIPHKQLKSQLSLVIKDAFKSSGKSFISVYKNDAKWTNSPKEKTLSVNCEKVIHLLYWLIDNIYVTFGDKIFRQKIGIPMGTDCAPFLANLFLYSYESKWIEEQRVLKNYSSIKAFKHCCRYIDDLLLANNDDLMIEVMKDIYPKELVLVPDDSDGLSTPFLDLQLVVKDGVVSTSIFDKRDAFDFKIINFPTLTGNIPLKSSYGVFICEAVRYARACTHFEDFKDRLLLLVKKLKAQFFSDRLLKKTYLNFCNSHLFLVQKYGSTVLNLHKFW